MLSRTEALEIMEQLMPNSTHTAGPSIFFTNDVSYASVLAIADNTGSVMFSGCPSRCDISGTPWIISLNLAQTSTLTQG